MTTYNTGNPIGSAAVKDLYDNAENLDTAVNDTSRDTWSDRLGRSRKTMSGMERQFDAAEDYREATFIDNQNRFNNFIASSGYQFLGDYAAGIEITEYNQILRDSDREFWRLSGQVELPYTTTGAGLPEDDALIPVGDAVLRQELAGPGGAALVGGVMVYASSISELKDYNLNDGRQISLESGNRSGIFVVKTGVPPSDPYEGIYIVLNNGKYAERVISDGTVFLKWFDPVVDGHTDQQELIQSAVNLTPVGYTLDYAGLSGIILIDIPSGQGDMPRGVYFDRPMKVKGNVSLVTKVKDFCSAWINYTDVLHAYQVESSGVVIDGLVVDANADNHYEIDGLGYKWWEYGPDLRRPPGGICVRCAPGQDNVEGVVVENCVVDRPLGGITAFGSESSLPDPNDFLSGTSKKNIVVSPVFRNNTVNRARGNDYLFNGGVIGGKIYNNKSYNSCYHSLRFYSATIDCHAFNNDVFTDFDEIATGYNDTALWYWRTNKVDDGQYLIRRSGFRIGASYNINENCSMTDNTIMYSSATPQSDIIDLGSSEAFSVQALASAVKNIQMSRNKSYRSPFGGIYCFFGANSPFGKDTVGVTISDNNFYNCQKRQSVIFGNNIAAYGNYFENCTPQGAADEIITLKGNNIRYYKNTHVYDLGSNNNSRFSIRSLSADGENDMFISDNVLRGFNGSSYTKADESVKTHGTNIGIKLDLENGWVDNQGGVFMRINCAGLVVVEGALNGALATDDSFFTLPFPYRRTINSYLTTIAVQYASIGDGTDVGDVFPLRIADAFMIDKLSKTASRVSVGFSYQARSTNGF